MTMTMTLQAKQRRRRRQRAVGYVLVVAAWAGSIGLSTVLAPPEWLHLTALFVHLASLIVGLGAVLMVEWYALLWASEWRTVHDLRRVDKTLRLPIWLGLFGLLASGALLQPDLESPLTIVKLVAVLILALNGVALTRFTTRFVQFPLKMRFTSLPIRVRISFIGTAVLSQLAWWTAVGIGLLNTTT